MPHDSRGPGPDRLDVRVAVPPVSAVRPLGIQIEALVQQAIAGQVVVDRDDRGRTGLLRKRLQLFCCHPRLNDVIVERMLGLEATREQVEPQPAPLVLESSLVGEARGREGLAHVIGLHQPRARIDATHLAHRQRRPEALVVESAEELGLVSAVRVPVPVKAREPRRRQRLIDGRPVLYPRIALRDGPRVGRQLLRKARIEEAGSGWSAPVVEQRDDRAHVQLAQSPHPEVRDIPAALSDVLPQHRLAQCVDSQRSESFEVLDPLEVLIAPALVVVTVADTVHRAFDTAPELQRVHAVFPNASARVWPAIRAYSLRACATTWSML